MRKTRFMSLLFVVWSIAFFFVPEFRQGLQVTFFAWNLQGLPYDWLVRAGTIPSDKLGEAGRAAEQQRDARTLAFVALHSGSVQERLQYADQAVAIDPSLTWVYLSLFHPALEEKQNPPDAQALVARLEKWDPDNAVPYFFEAEEVVKRKGIEISPLPGALDTLAKETEWCQAMQKGYAAPRYDTYAMRRFELERTWLRQNHLDKPAIILLSVWAYPKPNLLHIRTYTNLLVDKYGKEAEEAGHQSQALGYYWAAENFAARMRLHGGSLIERLIGATVQIIANQRLVPALRKAGQTDGAVALEVAGQQLDSELATLRGKDPLAQSANYNWAALTVQILAALVAVFGVLTLVCLVYLNAKRWIRPEVRGRLFQVLMIAGNYMPVLFFLTCAGLYLSYYPYAQNFHHYMTAGGEVHDFEPLFFNVFPNYGAVPGYNALAIGSPFRPYVWYALVGLALVVILAVVLRRRAANSER
jgi:tetratricopeptide (TPR) repeat protein